LDWGYVLHVSRELPAGRDIIGICGLVGGTLDHRIETGLAEVHLLKSEYAQARKIHIRMTKTNSPDENALSYAISFLYIAHTDIVCGNTGGVLYHQLNQAKEIFCHHMSPTGMIYSKMFQADMELREEQFDSAKIKFLECLHSCRGTASAVESFCFERLADIESWPSSEWQSRWPVIYLSHACKSRNKLAFHKALLFLGDVLIAIEGGNTASNLYSGT
jgi:hypothetical protein